MTPRPGPRPRAEGIRTLRGFTLTELLVVIAVIALLIGILLPVLGSARATGRNALCLSNLRQWGIALEIYKVDSDYYLPIASHSTGSSAKDDPGDDKWYNALPPRINAPKYTDIYDGSKTDEYENASIWWCPEQRQKYGIGGFTDAGNAFDYSFNVVLDGSESYSPPPSDSGQIHIQAERIPQVSETIAMTEKKERHEWVTIGKVDETRHFGSDVNMLFIDSHVSGYDGQRANRVYSGPGEAIDTPHWTTHDGDVTWGSFRE